MVLNFAFFDLRSWIAVAFYSSFSRFGSIQPQLFPLAQNFALISFSFLWCKIWITCDLWRHLSNTSVFILPSFLFSVSYCNASNEHANSFVSRYSFHFYIRGKRPLGPRYSTISHNISSTINICMHRWSLLVAESKMLLICRNTV